MIPLSIQNVQKQFTLPNGTILKAVDDVSLSIEPGSIHGLLGPNGAGKSTLISMIAGMTLPTSGSISLFGIDVVADPDRAKGMIGIVPQELVVEMAFTVQEVLYYFSGMYGVPAAERQERIDKALEDLQLIDKKNEKAKALSGGMKRRLMIAKAILHRPKLLILDEPTAGVDVALRQKIWELVRRLNAEGTTILFTTHYLEEAEQLCESITLVNHGKVIKQGKLKDIQREFSKNTIHFTLFNRDVPHLTGVNALGSDFEYPMTHLGDDVAKLAAHYGDNLKDVKSEAASLEQIFLTLTA
ncbi:MAG: ABC transporter ATP-binding protein [Patescibacteria group bacterium]